MRVFLAGSTGVLGRRLVRILTQQGHQVVALVRSESAEHSARALGAQLCCVSIFDPDALARAAEGCDVVIHAATSIPVKTRPSASDWAMNDKLRREGTRALAACAHHIGARCYVQQSVIWVVSSPDGTWFDEGTPPKPDAVSQSALDGEQIALEAGTRHGFTVAVLRCGWFYGPDAAHTCFLGQSLKARRLPLIGDGQALWSVLHLDDAASAFATAIGATQSGVWHVVDEMPVRVADFLNTFADLLNVPRPRRVPVWLARLVAGSYTVDFFTRSSPTRNRRFRETFGWQPQFPTYHEGWSTLWQHGVLRVFWRVERREERVARTTSARWVGFSACRSGRTSRVGTRAVGRWGASLAKRLHWNCYRNIAAGSSRTAGKRSNAKWPLAANGGHARCVPVW